MRRRLTVFLLFSAASTLVAQNLSPAKKIWSVGPLTQTQTARGFSVGPGGATFSGPQVDTQTRSIFSATRSVVFAGDRIVIASQVGTRRLEGAQAPVDVYELLSLDAATGAIKETREFLAFGSLVLFATDDAHVIEAGRTVIRLTPDLKDDGSFDYNSTGHKFGSIENASPDGKTLGIATSPGYQLIDTHTLRSIPLTATGLADTSVSDHGVITDNVHWIRDYPKDPGFVTYYDASGDHLLYHGECSGRPQFLTNDRILVPGCNQPPILDLQGHIVRAIHAPGYYGFAGVSQNGKLFALQFAKFDQSGTLKQERFVIYSVETGEPVTQIEPDEKAEAQSWTAFSPDGSLFVVGSPLKLTLFRLP